MRQLMTRNSFANASEEAVYDKSLRVVLHRNGQDDDLSILQELSAFLTFGNCRQVISICNQESDLPVSR